jgi:hypothetical protein
MKRIVTRQSGLLIAIDYLRVVHGGRGDYVEFAPEHIIWEETFIPEAQKYRVRPEMTKVYYIEHRTKRDYVKIYEQRRTVSYADYKVGLIYMSPADIKRLS